MDLINKQVIHKVFGKGSVVEYNGSYVIIKFPLGNKNFIFPDAFGGFLTLTDQRTAALVEKLVKERKEEYKQEELRIKKQRALQEERRRLFLERERMKKRCVTDKIHPSSQSAFWCKDQEQESIFKEGEIFTGKMVSGPRKGQPRNLIRLNYNSACLITARRAGEPEENRRILGAFMVQEDFSGKACKDGLIPAHSKYKFSLSPQEAKKTLFWNYYVNKNYPHRMTWNSGRHRYFDNIWMAQILRDVISYKKKSKEKEQIQRFFTYFCEKNKIKKEEIPAPNGALLRT